MLLYDLEHERADFAAMTDQRKQQSVAVIEFCSIEFSVLEIDELLDGRGPKIIPFEGRNDAPIGRFHPRGVQTGVFEHTHAP